MQNELPGDDGSYMFWVDLKSPKGPERGLSLYSRSSPYVPLPLVILLKIYCKKKNTVMGR